MEVPGALFASGPVGATSVFQKGYIKAELQREVASVSDAISVVPIPICLTQWLRLYRPGSNERAAWRRQWKCPVKGFSTAIFTALFYINLFDGGHWCDSFQNKNNLFQTGDHLHLDKKVGNFLEQLVLPKEVNI